jgi:hypothetical protein
MERPFTRVARYRHSAGNVTRNFALDICKPRISRRNLFDGARD